MFVFPRIHMLNPNFQGDITLDGGAFWRWVDHETEP